MTQEWPAQPKTAIRSVFVFFSPLHIVLAIWGAVHWSSAMAQDAVHFPDANLKSAVEEALWVTDPTPTDMLGLRSFSCIDREVKDIKGLQYAENLQTLYLTDNEFSSISPLSGMNSLRKLVLNNNQISSLSHLSGLKHLTYLDLHENQISNISALAGLDNLQVLVLRLNQIKDISPLSGLTNLRDLDLRGNQLSSISPLAGLHALQGLNLRSNQISNLSALGNLTNLTHLYLNNNSISTIAPLASLARLRDLYLSHNQINSISALLDLTHLQTLDLRYNPLGSDFVCRHLNTIMQNNPGLSYFYDGACDPMTSSSVPPDVSKEPVTDITENSVTLSARVVSDGKDGCEGRFRYWITGQAESTTAWHPSLQSGMIFEQEIQDLQPDCQYNFVAELKNSVGLDSTGTGSFKTTLDQFVLSIGSSIGGHVLNPGEGDFNIARGTSIPIMARAVGHHSLFLGWTGSAVDAGVVDEAHDPNTSVLVNDSYTLKANFRTKVIYVDGDGPSDPWPHDLQRGDPLEDGSADHPFDSIQEAIADAASDGFILVRPGTYYEGINLMGKDVTVTGIAPGSTELAALPIIDGNNVARTVTFAQGEGPQCRFSGFVLTRGLDEMGAAIACLGSSPSISHCLIAGNRCNGPYGAIIYCQNSSPVFEYLTLHGNQATGTGAAFRSIASNAVISNSILWGNVPTEIVVESDHDPLVSYSNIMDTWPGPGNIALDPEFALPGFWTDDSTWIPGDYHLMSELKRWDPDSLTWVPDTLSSPCIDAGDPNACVHEPLPNGARTNMGVYGGTDQASCSFISVLAL